ncbi:MAG TPA: group 1 truncated hemoglobin [Thermoanaerobaculia bacterium]|jgi:hemoglobin|nr:group 1 truncated hemoglobin [Thermoanaerobaculia bacterium]
MNALRGSKSLLSLIAAALLILGASAAWAGDDKAAAEKSLYERLGGLAPISVVVSDFIDALVPDEMLNQNPAIREARERVPAAYLKFHVTALVCQATGGPCQYTGRTMKESHAHLHITEAEWQRMAQVFKQILDKYKVPEKEQQDLFAVVGTTKADIVTAK